jgi:quinohemoprotein ethanol dehydrogenase
MKLGARITDDSLPWPTTPEPAVHFGGVYIQLLVRDPDDDTGALLAWDPVAQQARWRVARAALWNGGVLSTAGGLVFQGTADGEFLAHDALTGAQRWQFDAGNGIIASPITYTVGGKQYISLLVGWGGTVGPISELTTRGWKFGAQPRRLLTFALDGTASLPPTAPRDYVVHALDDPAVSIDETQAAEGRVLYQANCAYCHGRYLVTAGAPASDLRESPLALHWETLRAVVKDGVLLPKLMPQFKQLNDDQLRAIFIYVRSGARQALNQRPSVTH